VKLLLDTHIWLWGLLEPGRLSPRVAAALASPDGERWLSPLSIWEALLLITGAIDGITSTSVPMSTELPRLFAQCKSIDIHRDPVR